MSKSVQIRVDNGYAKMLKEMQQTWRRSLNDKPVTIVQVTRILKDDPNRAVVFYKQRSKRVIL